MFSLCAADRTPASVLLAAMEAEIFDQYDGLDLNDPSMPAAGVAEFSPPGGGYVVGYLDGEPVAGGGFKDLHADGACEIKRMYVAPSARGRGVGVSLLAAIEDAARAAGYRVARLDTGPRQPKVAQMYRDASYREIPNFNANPLATFFGEKPL